VAPFTAARGAWTATLTARSTSDTQEMGWKEREARQALDVVRPHVGPDEPVEAVLHRCLAVLRIPTRPTLDRAPG
jgi:hypothetical protein